MGTRQCGDAAMRSRSPGSPCWPRRRDERHPARTGAHRVGRSGRRDHSDFGLSEPPAEYGITPAEHARVLAAFVEMLGALEGLMHG